MAGEYIRNTQTTTEVLRDGAPKIRNTQVATEVMRDGIPKIRCTQVTVEVLRSCLEYASIAAYYYRQRRR